MFVDKTIELVECDKCGCCCRSPGIRLVLPVKSDGSCLYLNKNTCTIYNNRPDFCNNQTTFKKFYEQTITADKYIDMTRLACKLLKKL